MSRPPKEVEKELSPGEDAVVLGRKEDEIKKIIVNHIQIQSAVVVDGEPIMADLTADRPHRTRAALQ